MELLTSSSVVCSTSAGALEGTSSMAPPASNPAEPDPDGCFEAAADGAPDSAFSPEPAPLPVADMLQLVSKTEKNTLRENFRMQRKFSLKYFCKQNVAILLRSQFSKSCSLIIFKSNLFCFWDNRTIRHNNAEKHDNHEKCTSQTRYRLQILKKIVLVTDIALQK